MTKSKILKKVIKFLNQPRVAIPGSLADFAYEKESEPKFKFQKKGAKPKRPQFGYSNYPNYSYYLHLLVTSTMDTFGDAGLDAERVYKDAMTNVYLAMQAWMGKIGDLSSYTRHQIFSDTSFTLSLEYLRDLLHNLKDTDPKEFWDRGQVELMLKLIVPMLFETRNLEKKVARIHKICKAQLNSLKPILSTYKVEDFDGERKPLKRKDKNLVPDASIMSIPVRKGGVSTKLHVVSQDSTSTMTIISDDESVGSGRRIVSRLKKVWYFIICVHKTKTETHVLKSVISDGDTSHKTLATLYEGYEFYQKEYLSRPCSPVKPAEPEVSMDVIADAHTATTAQSICEGLYDMSDTMKHRLVQLGVMTADLNYVHTESTTDSCNSLAVEPSLGQGDDLDLSVSENIEDDDSGIIELESIYDSNGSHTSLFADPTFGSESNINLPESAKAGGGGALTAGTKRRVSAPVSRVDSAAVLGTQLESTMKKTMIPIPLGSIENSKSVKEMNPDLVELNQTPVVNIGIAMEETEPPRVFYDKVKVNQIKPRGKRSKKSAISNDPSGFELPTVTSSERLRQREGELETMKNFAFLHQNREPIKLDSKQSVEKVASLNSNEPAHQELYTVEPPYDSTLPADPFTAFTNIIKEDRAMIEGAVHAITVLELGLYNCRFEGMLSDPKECIAVQDLVTIMVEKGNAYMEIKGDPLYRDEENYLTRCLAKALNNAERCTGILGEFLEMLQIDVATLEAIVGEYSNVDNEDEIMQLFGGSYHNDLKYAEDFEFDYEGTKLDEDDMSGTSEPYTRQ